MYSIKLTKEEREILIIQVACRLDVFDVEMARASDDARRIEEIIKYREPLKKVLDKLYASVDTSNDYPNTACLLH